jgi:mono/diheme cytochrome c family protein
MKHALKRWTIGGAIGAAVGAALYAYSAPPVTADRVHQPFLAAYKVFMHPRCVNCHPAGDVPLQGDEGRLHMQNVKRGPRGKGLYALKCSNCHQAANVPGENMPPGNPDWRLPPPEMPMVFQGRTPGELARQLKDPRQNGGMTLEALLHHVEEDALVTWGWDPGEGRTKPPLTHAEFVRAMREWIESGAPVPNP